MLRSRRLALIATAAISVSGVVLAACGDAVDTTGRGLQVFHLGANGGNAGTASGEMATADKMMPYMATTFVFDGEMAAMPDSAASYLLVADVSTDQVAALAAALGVEGDVRTLGADMGGGWMVGPEDYSGATLTVSGDGVGSWWYSPDPSVYESTGYTCESVSASGESSAPADTIAPTDTIVVGADPCPAPEPPAGVPSADAALANMQTLLGGLGLDPAAYEFDTYADEWNASVTGYYLIDGVRSPLTVGASWGAEGALMWASGSFAEPQRGADYPLARVDQGLVRLNDRSGGWSYYGSPTVLARGGVVGIATDTASDTVIAAPSPVDAVTTIAPTPDTVVVSTDDTLVHPTPATPVDCDPAADCVVVDPMVPMEPVTVHLYSVELGLTMVWDADGSVWLLPAYVFGTTDGGEYSVIAVDDEYLDLPDTPVATDTTVVGGGTDGSTGSGTIDGVVVTIDVADASSTLVGLAEDEATKVAAERGWTLRVVQRDGESLPVTMDYRTDRVNVVVDGGKVTSVDSIA